MNVKENDTVVFNYNTTEGIVKKSGKVVKVIDHGKMYGLSVNIFDGKHIHQVNIKNVTELLEENIDAPNQESR